MLQVLTHTVALYDVSIQVSLETQWLRVTIYTIPDKPWEDSDRVLYRSECVGTYLERSNPVPHQVIPRIVWKHFTAIIRTVSNEIRSPWTLSWSDIVLEALWFEGVKINVLELSQTSFSNRVAGVMLMMSRAVVWIGVFQSLIINSQQPSSPCTCEGTTRLQELENKLPDYLASILTLQWRQDATKYFHSISVHAVLAVIAPLVTQLVEVVKSFQPAISGTIRAELNNPSCLLSRCTNQRYVGRWRLYHWFDRKFLVFSSSPESHLLLFQFYMEPIQICLPILNIST